MLSHWPTAIALCLSATPLLSGIVSEAECAPSMAPWAQPPAAVPNQRPGTQKTDLPHMPSLLVGQPAPRLNVDRWVKGGPIENFEPGRIYVVEFWATWCTPCRRSIPHLTDLQRRFQDQGVTVIGVASQESSAGDLGRFVARQGDKLGYAVALDSNGATNQAWMVASRQRGIPTAFLVDKNGKVAWIGHPLDGLETALSQVAAGTYDLAGAADAFRRRAELEARAEPLIRRFQERSESGEHKSAISAADELVALDPAHFGEYAWLKFQIMAFALKDSAGAYAYAREAIEGPLKDNPDALESLAWTILDDARLEQRDLSVARAAAERAEQVGGGKRPRAIAALAKVAAAEGDIARAVELQARALELTTSRPMKDDFQRMLDEYKSRAK